ncbi:hypothetical protein [Neobacillus niacini]|uniref:hypothetical protein n=1 Tax=Neobacillus niacini TaxID=86668 RepID=UPI0028602CED|nr:hypothetical protein [Neobacillus niacini]MDR6999833.1 hypothetical protein [Neobacillus niacini]
MAIVKYSTGPIDNQESSIYPGNIYANVDILILNNNQHRAANVTIKLFKLQGQKQLVITKKRRVVRNTSSSVSLDVSGLDKFEIQFIVNQPGTRIQVRRSVLLTATGSDEAGQFVSRLPIKITV